MVLQLRNRENEEDPMLRKEKEKIEIIKMKNKGENKRANKGEEK